MSHRLRLAPHLSPAEVHERYRTSSDVVEKTRWQALHLVQEGWRTADIHTVTGYSGVWIRKLVQRYNESGPAAMEDQRHHNPGQPRLLSRADESALVYALEHEVPPGGGLWNGNKVARWIAARLGRPVARARGWEALHRLGWTPQRPRRRHAEADVAAQERFPAAAPAARSG